MVFSPLTIASYAFTRPTTSSDFTVSISWRMCAAQYGVGVEAALAQVVLHRRDVYALTHDLVGRAERLARLHGAGLDRDPRPRQRVLDLHIRRTVEHRRLRPEPERRGRPAQVCFQ